MIIFWLVCAVFVAIALAFILPPLLEDAATRTHSGGQKEANIAIYRDQLSELQADLANGIVSREQFDQDRDEIERRLLEDVTSTSVSSAKSLKPTNEGRGAVYVVALSLPILAVAIYLGIGNPYAAPTPVPTSASAPAPAPVAPTESADVSQQRIEANVAALAKRLEQNPGDLEGWKMLARSYVSQGKYGDASTAYEKANALKPNDADLLADYAFSLAMAGEEKLQGKPLELIRKALQLDPENPKALELAGSAAFEAQDYKQAIQYWQSLLDKVPANSEVAESLTERINTAKTRVGSDGTK